MSSYEVIKGFLKSEDFKKLYSDYLKKKDIAKYRTLIKELGIRK